MSKKNIIVIISDQHAGSVCGFAGHPYVKTPNLDRLAEDSVVFQNAYCPAPICGPSRFAFLTGQHVHRCGAYDNGSSLRYDEPTLGTLMVNAGYRSVLCGRMHIHGPDQYVGFEERPVSGWINPIHSSPSSMLPKEYAFPPFQGFENGENFDHFQTSPLKLKSIDDHTISTACEIIRTHEKSDSRPLFMVIGLYGPHPSVANRECYAKYVRMYDEMEMETAKGRTSEEFNKLPPHVKNIALVLGKGELPDDELNRRKTCEYFARISYTDALIGEVLDATIKAGLYDESSIVYTSDHGEAMGYKGIWGKVAFLENCVNIPFLMKSSGNSIKRKIKNNISLVDLFPTFAEMTDTIVPYNLSGASLLPLIEGDEASGDDVLSQYHGIYTNTSSFMLKSGRYKYNFYNDDPPELFDMENDPGECDNLADNPQYDSLRRMLHEKLLEKLGESPDSIEERIRANQAKRQFIADSVGKSSTIKERLEMRISEWRGQRKEPWWDEEGARYMRNGESQLQRRTYKAKS